MAPAPVVRDAAVRRRGGSARQSGRLCHARAGGWLGCHFPGFQPGATMPGPSLPHPGRFPRLDRKRMAGLRAQVQPQVEPVQPQPGLGFHSDILAVLGRGSPDPCAVSHGLRIQPGVNVRKRLFYADEAKVIVLGKLFLSSLLFFY
jgi:hypothetical protein